ncbi:MAG: aminopeptidase [Lewinellaceae bacterium]|nr:aminopeptidase [Saprospiraceae bacterium]MCB9331058.1 aminopeptidase [Lewinellaceae bacterium]
MKKIMISLLIAVVAWTAAAQDPEPFDFKEYITLPTTPVKSQDRTGTCWSFSTTSFLESELLRMGKGAHDLSEMFTVRNIYHQKCENYVRRLGAAQLSEGGLAHDNLNAVRQYGVVPESVYPGRKDPSKPFNHTRLIETLQAMCNEFVAQAKKGKLPEDWLNQIDAVLDNELGPVPVTFTYKNIQFTPTSFRDYLGLRPDDYVSITSFSHHPFWSSFVLEVPDNFSNGQFFNMPLSDLIRCLNYSLQQGYTVEWDADVSNPGFSARNNGLALVPETDWSNKTKEQMANTFTYWEPEKAVGQQYRQEMFDRMETQDDHLMHIAGIVNETNGGIYYRVKNSYGEASGRQGFVLVSEAYMRLNTLSLTLHKNALPKDISQRMGLTPGDATIEHPAADPSDQKGDAGGEAPRSLNTKTKQPARSMMRIPNAETAPAKRATSNSKD